MPDDSIRPEPIATTAAETAGPPPRRHGRSLRVFCIFAALFSVALWGSWQLRSHFGQEDNRTEAPRERPNEPSKAAAKPASPVDILARGDNALRQLRYAEAMSHYRDLLENGLPKNAALAYRLGLCSESVGALDKAIVCYRQAIGASVSPPLTFACHLGMARCQLSQKRAVEARRLLYPFLFDERRHRNVPPDFVTEAYYLVALSHARENNAREAERLAQDAPVSFAAVPLQVPIYLDFAAAGEPARGDGAAGPIPAPLAVQKGSANEPAMVLCAEQAGRPAAELLEKLALEGGMKVEWTAQAKKSLADRKLPLYLHNWALRDVLEHAADYLDLACWMDGDTVRFSTRAETDNQRLAAIRRGLTQRSLHAALRADSAHPLAAAALLEYGNSEAIQGKWRAAASWYSRLVRDPSPSPYVLSAYFNIARVRLRSSEFAQARQAFFRVIDQAPGHELALRAGIQIGLLYLQEDEARQAITLLRRAQASAVESPYRPVATLTLAAAYLHDGDLESARKTLAQSRAVLQAAPYRPTAAFLDAYAQYRLAKATHGMNPYPPDVADMIGTLWRNKDETILGPYGQWLVAQAYDDLGFSAEAERLLRPALPEARGPFKAAVAYALAETLVKRGQADEAARLFSQCAQAESRYRARARFQLARLDLEQQRFGACAETCQKLWRERAFPEESALLGLWGAALEGSGDLAKAAKCYAGKAPE